MKNLIQMIIILTQKYKDPSIVIQGDFNMDLNNNNNKYR
jgi:hypothetical protein